MRFTPHTGSFRTQSEWETDWEHGEEGRLWQAEEALLHQIKVRGQPGPLRELEGPLGRELAALGPWGCK